MRGKTSSILIVLAAIALCASSSPVSEKPIGSKKDRTSIERLNDDDLDPVADASSDYEDAYLGTHQGYLQPSSSPNVEIDHSIELEGGSQTFFPAFANLFRQQPLGHSRPLTYNNQEGAYSQRPNALRQLLNYPNYNGNGGAYRSNDYAKAIASGSDANGLLGSGNFGVIHGGTFFSESSDTESQFSDASFDSPYNNGHGRPSSFYFGGNSGNPRPNHNQEQFANFRDFADINAPSPNSAFSHYVVVYANKNGTLAEITTTAPPSADPKNIMEKLTMIEQEQRSEPKKDKTSRGKVKLALHNEKKKHAKIVKKMLTKEDAKETLVDPLLALS